MIFYNIKKKISEIFFSEEPDWYWGLFCILFPVITIDYILYKDLSIISYRPYFPLPLFKFFHIPDPALLEVFLEQFLQIDTSLFFLFLFLKVVLIFSLIFCVIGVFQKFFIALSLISFFLFQGWLYGYFRTADDPYVYHSANIVCFILLVWLFSPFNRWTAIFWIKKVLKRIKSGKDNNERKNNIKNHYPVWPRLLIILTIAIAFFGSFYCKFDKSGFQWINGYTLQGFLLHQSARNFFLTKGYWLSQQSFYVIWFLNIGVYVFQFTAPVGFLFKKTRLFYAFVGTVFHICIVLFFGFWFTPFQYFYVVFIPEIMEFVQMLSKKFRKSHFLKKGIQLDNLYPLRRG